MRNQLRALPVAVGLTAALVAIVAIVAAQGGAGEAAPTPLPTPDPRESMLEAPQSIGVECYRGSLSEDEDPSIWVPHYERIALVQAHAGESAVGPELEPFAGIVQIYTTVSVTFEEWIKGEGPKEGGISFWGGTSGNVTMTTDSCNDSLAAGERAVVFLRENAVLPGEGSFDVAYVISDGVATSMIDDRSLAADELLQMLRAAKDDPAPTPLPYPDDLPPVVHLPKSTLVAQVAITSTEETESGTVIRASVSELIKGDVGKTVGFTMLQEYNGGEVPADMRLGVGDEAVILLRDDGTLFDWYLYWGDGTADSWVDGVSMPVERLLDVLRDNVALN